jgi:DNA-directed RNA polymerase subunit RPC12/RpoP
METIICDQCGTEMNFEGSCIDKKTETISIEYLEYTCPECGRKFEREREV